MQIYMDNDKDTVTVVQSVASASTMISSVAVEAKNYIVSKFPDNFFKHIYIDTSQTVTQQSYNEKYSKTANKIPYPSMTITPIMSLDDPIGGMEKTMHLSSPNLYLRKDINRTYNKLVVDPDQQFAIYYTSDYITTNFDFKITLNTYIQNVNTAFYLKSRFQQGFFQYLNHKYLQTEIPKSLIRLIADIKDYDLSDKDDMDSLRLYLIGTSKSEKTIQKKINTGTSKQCFFLNQPQNLLVLFTDLDCPPSVIREAQVEGEYVINFRLQVSCWVPNAFILNINRKKLNQLSEETINHLDSGNDELETGILSANIYTDRDILTKNDTIYFTDNNGKEQIGHLVYSETFTHELNKQFTDIKILYDNDSDFSKIMRYATEQNNIDISSLVHIKLFTNQGEVPISEYSIDYKNMKVYDFSDNINQSDIAVALYVNRLAYESLKKAYESDSFYFNSNFLTTIFAKTVRKDEYGNEIEDPVKLVLRSFVNEKELSTTNINKSLRVNTSYGIGYVGLSDKIDDENENAYKICLGYDSNNQPIIKKLEIKEA